MHPETMTIARRLSSRNEPDLLRESYTEDDDLMNFSMAQCKKISLKVSDVRNLPIECRKHAEIVQSIVSRNTEKKDYAKAFQGMSPGEAAAAMRARETGKLSHAQIQRRMTKRS